MMTTTQTTTATTIIEEETMYTTKGSVRGWCGHEHPTLAEAAACVDADEADCAAVPGGQSYSDRRVVRVDGAKLGDDEIEELQAIYDRSEGME